MRITPDKMRPFLPVRPLLLAASVLLCAALLPVRDAAAAERVLFEKNSLYQYLLVSEDKTTGLRHLYSNEKHLKQGGMDVRNPDRLVFEYYRMSLIALAFLDVEPKDILVVGLGAGSVPKYLNRYFPAASIDVVEIDPDVVAIAKKYFLFKENDRMKVQVNDGRMFIKRTKKKYDLVFLDAYRNGGIPFHLTTKEFLLETKKILKPGGVVTSNILSPSSNAFHDAMIVTYRNAFEHLHLFVGDESGNYIFVATDHTKDKQVKEIRERAKRIAQEKRFDFDLAGIVDGHRYGSALREVEAELLTDDFAPVDILKHRKGGKS